jgi:hypothetical protein
MRSDRLALTANLIAGFAVGSVVLTLGLQAIRPALSAPTGFRLDAVDAAPLILLLTASGLTALGSLRRFGWLVSAAGVGGAVVLFAQGDALPAPLFYPVVGLSVGLLLGGVLLAVAATPPAGRWAIVAGLGAGVAAGPYLLYLLGNATRSALGGATDIVFAGVLALILAVAWGLLLGQEIHDEPERPVAVMVIVAALVVLALGVGWQIAFEAMSADFTGGISENQARQVELTDHLVKLLIGVLATAVLVLAAYRRGGPNAARWVVVGLALALTPLIGGVGTHVDRFACAAAGAVVGAFVAYRLPRMVPWEAVGVGAAAAGMLLGVPAVTMFGVGLAVTAGLALAGGPAVTALGFAALVLVTQATGTRFSGTEGPYVVIGAMLALVVLFLLGLRAPGGSEGESAPAGPVVPAPRDAVTDTAPDRVETTAE